MILPSSCVAPENIEIPSEDKLEGETVEIVRLAKDTLGLYTKDIYGEKYKKLLAYTNKLMDLEKRVIYNNIRKFITVNPRNIFGPDVSNDELAAWVVVDALLVSTNDKCLIREIISTTPDRQIGNQTLMEYLEIRGFNNYEIKDIIRHCDNESVRELLTAELNVKGKGSVKGKVTN